MNISNKIQKAINISATEHRTHERIGLKYPYIVHPFSVALIVSHYTQDEDTFCAALLHDVVEDSTTYTFEKMKTDFGSHITDIVRAITEDKGGADTLHTLRQNWHERKKKYLEKLKSAPQESLIICAADSIHNLRSLIETNIICGASFWDSFGASMENKLNHYNNIIVCLEKKLSSSIVDELKLAYADTALMYSSHLKTNHKSSTHQHVQVKIVQRSNI